MPGGLLTRRAVLLADIQTAEGSAATLKAELHAILIANLNRNPNGEPIERNFLRDSLSPLPIETIVSSVRKTGRLVVVHEASSFLGMASEISALVTEQCFYELEAPVIRVGGANIPYPPSRMEEDFLPDLDRILDGVDRALSF